MFDHAKEAVDMIKGRKREDLDSDRMLNLALVRLLEVVGKAANRMPKNEREKYPSIPWNEVINLRNRLIHGYDAVDFDILWEIATKDLPPLVSNLKSLIPQGGR